jgi:hypothetical protein
MGLCIRDAIAVEHHHEPAFAVALEERSVLVGMGAGILGEKTTFAPSCCKSVFFWQIAQGAWRYATPYVHADTDVESSSAWGERPAERWMSANE